MASKWKWCVEDDNGKTIKGWYQDKDKWYYLNDEGIMQTGWIKDKDGRWYYLDSDGSMKTGWIKDKGKWYYLETISNGYKGSMYCNGTYTIDGKSYKFDSSGAWIEDTDNSVSDNLCKMISVFEGCRLKAYRCTSGVLTIGIGCTNKKWTSKGTITIEEAYQAFQEDIKVFVDGVTNLCKNASVNLNIYEREALISFAFNCGLGSLEKSTLWQLIKAGNRNVTKITNAFLMWTKSGGKEQLGLVKRRNAEARLFLTGKYTLFN